MRTVDEHLAKVLALGKRLGTRMLPLDEAFGHTLVEDLVARIAVPPFDNSAMDGYAVNSVDVAVVPRVLRVVEDIPAGAHEPFTLSTGEAARIMTGAPMPLGADAVVPVEQTDAPIGPSSLPTSVEIREGVGAGRHVRRRGEDVAVGDLVLPAGSLLTPAAVAAAASVGYGKLLVVRRPKVVAIATGAELETPGQSLAYGQIPDSNTYLMRGLLRQFGAEVRTLVTSDDPGEFRQALEEASADADLIVTSGGVSVGAFEVVRQVTGDECEFTNVAMQPGKPQGIGVVEGVPLLAFPGNPVSVFVSSWLFARPLLAKMAGRTMVDHWRLVPALEAWRTPPVRTQYLPALVTDQGVRRAHRLGSGSHAIASLHLANALARVPADVDEVQLGDIVEVLDTDG